MNRDTAIAIIKRHEAELRQLGVVSLSLFGSTARNEAGSDSDIDVAIRTDHSFPHALEYFGRLADIQQRLSDILGTNVDVIHEPATRPPLQRAIDQDRQLAY
jgi:predicted nucleotidyltransferase